MAFTLHQEIESIGNQIKNVHDRIKSFIQDENNSLEDRWNLFVKAWKNGAYSEYSYYYIDFDFDGNRIEWYDDIHIERHETVYLVELPEYCEDYYEGYSESAVNKLKNDILLSGYTHFEFDW